MSSNIDIKTEHLSISQHNSLSPDFKDQVKINHSAGVTSVREIDLTVGIQIQRRGHSNLTHIWEGGVEE